MEIDGVTNQQINSIVPFDFMDDIYVYYFCISDNFKNNLMENSSATTLPIINKSRMSALKIPFPTLPEQKEIVSILDAVLSAEKEAEQKVGSVIEGIDLLKKSILARAFRGELGTNDPREAKAI